MCVCVCVIQYVYYLVCVWLCSQIFVTQCVFPVLDYKSSRTWLRTAASVTQKVISSKGSLIFHHNEIQSSCSEQLLESLWTRKMNTSQYVFFCLLDSLFCFFDSPDCCLITACRVVNPCDYEVVNVFSLFNCMHFRNVLYKKRFAFIICLLHSSQLRE